VVEPAWLYVFLNKIPCSVAYPLMPNIPSKPDDPQSAIITDWLRVRLIPLSHI